MASTFINFVPFAYAGPYLLYNHGWDVLQRLGFEKIQVLK